MFEYWHYFRCNYEFAAAFKINTNLVIFSFQSYERHMRIKCINRIKFSYFIMIIPNERADGTYDMNQFWMTVDAPQMSVFLPTFMFGFKPITKFQASNIITSSMYLKWRITNYSKQLIWKHGCSASYGCSLWDPWLF